MRTAVLCAVGLLLMTFAVMQNTTSADDFRQFYRAATLARAHENVFAHPTLSPATNAEEEFLPYNRIPSYAQMLRPLAMLPYRTARRVWVGFLVLALAGCVWLFPLRRDYLAIAMAFSLPVAFTFALAQDIGFVLLVLFIVARMYSKEREFASGLVASLLAIKLTYVPAVGLVFLAKSRRGTLGMATGIALQLAVSFAIEGSGWPAAYFALLRKSFEIFEVRRMPNIRAVAASISLPGGAWVAGALVVGVWLFVAARKLRLSDALVLALPLGLIASPYCFVYDSVVIIPLLVSAATPTSWDGWIAGVALTPIPYFMMMTGNAALVSAGSAVVVVSTLFAAVRFWRMRAMPPLGNWSVALSETGSGK